MTMGRDQAAGSLALTYKTTPSIEGRLALAKLDLDKWLELLTRPGFLPAAPAPAGKPKPPTQVNASLAIDVAEMTWRKDTIRDVSMALEMVKNVVSVPRLSATLPGDMTVQGGAMPDGTLQPLRRQAARDAHLARHRCRCHSQGPPAGPEGQRQIEVDGRRHCRSPTSSSISTGLRGKAGGTLSLGLPVTAALQVELDRLDLDAYMPQPSVAAVQPAAATANPTTMAANLGLKAKVAKLVYRGETLNGVEGDVVIQGNVLKLNNLQVADLLGGKLGLKGAVNDFAATPRFDVTFNASAPDTDKLLHYLRLPTFLNGKIGAASATGGVNGTMDAFTLRDVAVNFLGVSGRASGTLKVGDAFAFDFPNVALQSGDISRLVTVASGRSMNGLGALSAGGSLKGASQKATFTGELTARGTPMNGTIDASLGERPKISANLKVPGTLNIDHWLGVSATPVPAVSTLAARPGTVTGTPIDLSALRSFDASLTVFTSAMSVASLQINYCDFTASLTNGRLTLSKLTGQFYGGGVDFSGTVDATGSSLAVDVKGDVRGIYIGEMLRGTAGTNNFGNSDLTVAIDGKLDATGIRIAGKGRSPQEIRDDLAGNAAVGGTVYPNVVKGSQSFAQFATGVGSLFSDAMAFNNFILDAFINRQNTLAGQRRGRWSAIRLGSPRRSRAIAPSCPRRSSHPWRTASAATARGGQSPAPGVPAIQPWKVGSRHRASPARVEVRCLWSPLDEAGLVDRVGLDDDAPTSSLSDSAGPVRGWPAIPMPGPQVGPTLWPPPPPPRASAASDRSGIARQRRLAAARREAARAWDTIPFPAAPAANARVRNSFDMCPLGGQSVESCLENRQPPQWA